MKVLTFVLAICMLSIIGCSSDEEKMLAEGMDAYTYYDWETALALLTPLAEDGHPEAQIRLGSMYYFGFGVFRDQATAVKWYTLAAEQGHASALYMLGHANEWGGGVPENKVYAHMWYNLSRVQGHRDGAYERDVMEEEMTAAEIAYAEQLAYACHINEFKGCLRIYIR